MAGSVVEKDILLAHRHFTKGALKPQRPCTGLHRGKNMAHSGASVKEMSILGADRLKLRDVSRDSGPFLTQCAISARRSWPNHSPALVQNSQAMAASLAKKYTSQLSKAPETATQKR